MKINSIVVLFIYLLLLLPYLSVKGYGQFKDNLVSIGHRLVLKAASMAVDMQDKAEETEQMKFEIRRKATKILFLIGQLEKAQEKAVLKALVHALYREEYELSVLLRENKPPEPKLIRIWFH